MKKLSFFLAVFLLLICPLYSDSVFSLDLVTDISLGGGAAGLFVTSQLIPVRNGIQTELDSINAIDRLLIMTYRKNLDDLGTYASYLSLVTPLISVLYQFDSSRLITYGVMYAEAFLLTYGTKDLLKALIPRYRPYTYLEAVPTGEEDDFLNSFPSGHSSFAFLGATFLSYTFCREFPDSRWRLPLVISSYTLASAIAASRIISGNHFITDTLAGAAIGGLWGWLIPWLHTLPQKTGKKLSVQVGPSGLVFSFTL